MPHKFYGELIGLAVPLGIAVIGALSLMVFSSIERAHNAHDTQRTRYFHAALCFISSAFPVCFMFIEWGVHNTFKGLNQLFETYHIYGSLFWVMFAIDMLGFVTTPLFLLWFIRHPIKKLDYRYA